ncbi:MAG: ABC transporter ATP-binding protein [Bryobacteraceae bacterium]
MARVTTNTTPEAGKWLGWRVLSLFAPHRTAVVGLALLVMLTAGLDIAVPFITRGVIDGVVRALQSTQTGSFRSLLLAGGAIFALTAITRILRSLYNYRLFRLVSHAEDEVKNAAFSNFLHLDAEYQGAVNTGEVIGALDRGSTAVFVVLYEIFGQNLLPPTLVLVGVMATLLMTNPWIALIVFLPLPAYALAVGRLSRRMHRVEFLISHAFERVTKESFDIASNVRAVKKFCRETAEARTQRQLLYRARRRHYQGERCWALIENVQSLFSTAGRVGVIGLGGYLVLSHRCSVGQYILYIALQDMVYTPISQLSIILPKLRRNLSRAERLFEILDTKRAVTDAPEARTLSGPEHSIEFRDLRFRYAGAAQDTLRNVNMKVPAGATVALIGPSGSGKSTLVNLLQRLYDPQSGSILIDGQDLREVTQQSLRERIAVVPQEVELFSRSIRDNVAYGKDELNDAEIESAARMAQAHGFMSKCDEGYENQVGERGMKLSGGERQRLGIARAIARDPKILILDEATSHLDGESESLIQLAMDRVTRGRTSFIIAHRLSTVRKADLVVVVANNTVEAVGTHDELWASSHTYRKLHGIHFAEKPKEETAREVSEESELLGLAAT